MARPASLILGAMVALTTPVAWLLAWLSFPAEAGTLRGWNWVWPWSFAALGVLFYGDAFGFPLDAVVAVRWTGRSSSRGPWRRWRSAR